MKPTSLLPEMLLGDKNISPGAKLVYVATQIYLPSSMTALAKRTGLSISTVSSFCDQLAKQGWIFKAKSGHTVVPVPAIPHQVQEQMIRELQAGFSVSPLKGEYLMKKWLDYLIMSDDYMDNARLNVLQNPLTGEPLELDRHYPTLKIGFEHHGPQHFGPTKAFPDRVKFNELRSHDLMKKSLCDENGISLVVFTADDFTLNGILKKLPQNLGLPIRRIDPSGPYVRALEKLSTEYKAGLARIMAKESSASRAIAR